MDEKVSWKYVLCYLNNENCYLNTLIKHTLSNLTTIKILLLIEFYI